LEGGKLIEEEKNFRLDGKRWKDVQYETFLLDSYTGY